MPKLLILMALLIAAIIATPSTTLTASENGVDQAGDYHGFLDAYETANELPANDEALSGFVSYMGEYEKHLFDWYEAETEMQYTRVVDEGKKLNEKKLESACAKYFANNRVLNYQGILQGEVKPGRFGIDISSNSPTYDMPFTYKGLTPNKTRVILKVHVLTNTKEGMAQIEAFKKGEMIYYKAKMLGFEKKKQKSILDSSRSAYESLAPHWTYADKIVPLNRAYNLSRQLFNDSGMKKQKYLDEMNKTLEQIGNARKQFANDSWAGETIGVDENNRNGGIDSSPIMRSKFAERSPLEIRRKRPECTTLYLEVTAVLVEASKQILPKDSGDEKTNKDSEKAKVSDNAPADVDAPEVDISQLKDEGGKLQQRKNWLNSLAEKIQTNIGYLDKKVASAETNKGMSLTTANESLGNLKNEVDNWSKELKSFLTDADLFNSKLEKGKVDAVDVTPIDVSKRAAVEAGCSKVNDLLAKYEQRLKNVKK